MFIIVLANLWKLDLYDKVFTILAIQHLPYTKRQSSRTFLSQLVLMKTVDKNLRLAMLRDKCSG